MELRNISTKEIHPYPDNRVTDGPELQELADSIQAVGLLQPVIVTARKDSGYDLVAGHRRLAAFGLNGATTIPAILVSDNEPKQVRQVAENVHRKDLTRTQEARLYADLSVNEGWTYEQIATATGTNPTRVGRTIDLAALTPEMATMVDAKAVPLAAAFLVAKLSVQDQKDMADELTRWVLPLPMDEAISFIDSYARRLDSGKFDPSETYGGSLPDCGTCPKNTETQKGLFDDWAVTQAQCLDRGCFDAKVQAAFMKVKEEGEFDGVLATKDTFPEGMGFDANRFVPVERVAEVAKEKGKPMPGVKVFLTQKPDGTALRVMTRADLDEVKFPKTRTKATRPEPARETLTPEEIADRKKQRAKELLEQKIDRRLDDLMEDLVAKKAAEDPGAFLDAAAAGMLRFLHYDEQKRLAKRHLGKATDSHELFSWINKGDNRLRILYGYLSPPEAAKFVGRQNRNLRAEARKLLLDETGAQAKKKVAAKKKATAKRKPKGVK